MSGRLRLTLANFYTRRHVKLRRRFQVNYLNLKITRCSNDANKQIRSINAKTQECVAGHLKFKPTRRLSRARIWRSFTHTNQSRTCFGSDEVGERSRGTPGPVKVQNDHKTVENHWTDQYKHEVYITHTRFTDLSGAEASVFCFKQCLPRIRKGMLQSYKGRRLWRPSHKTLTFTPAKNELIPIGRPTCPHKWASSIGHIYICSILFRETSQIEKWLMIHKS